jgi:nucleoside-diphosphate-sugar epimerase
MSELAFRVIGQNPPFSRRSLAFFENDNAFDCSAAQRDLGYVPRVDLADGLRRTLTDTTWPVTL